MRRAPIIWSTILVLENIQSSEDLYDKVNEHEESLVAAFKRESREDNLTVHNLALTLRKMGIMAPQSRRANLTTAGEGTIGEDSVKDDEDPVEARLGDGGETLRQVYQTFKKRQRPPPKGGYPFSKNDHVKTKMGKAPPSPCKVCGSDHHWDRGCPDWEVYLEKQHRGVLIVAKDPAGDESDLLYHSAYMVLMDGRLEEKSF
jgi:hypothetical protein